MVIITRKQCVNEAGDNETMCMVIVTMNTWMMRHDGDGDNGHGYGEG